MNIHINVNINEGYRSTSDEVAFFLFHLKHTAWGQADTSHAIENKPTTYNFVHVCILDSQFDEIHQQDFM